jgi:hypothetical protein
MEESEPTIEEFVAKLRAELPDIRPNGEEDWDWSWADEGMDLLDNGELKLAERKFQELIVAQPNHFEGYEGLALVYQDMHRKREAVMLIGHAVSLAQEFLREEFIDRDVFDVIADEQHEILKMPDSPEPEE